ncbi:MAG: integrase family protein [Verrucomicrobiales bacterium]|nr:integrase family protein [Verrucomicrobiales bacterium]
MSTEIIPVKVDAEKRVIPRNAKRKVVSWRVTLGKKITGTRKQRRFFKTYKEAKDFISSSLEAKVQQGKEAFSIPQKLRVEALECARKLESYDVTLTTAVDYYIKHAIPKGGILSFSEVSAEFLVSRWAMNCKPKTMTQYESYVDVLNEEFGQVKVNLLRRQDLEDWLAESEWASRTRKNYLVTLTTILNFALLRDYCVTNPAAKIERPILDDKPPGILSPEQVKSLLKEAKETHPLMIPGICIGLFSGLRRSEVCSLDWNEIDVAEKHIEVKGIKSKTRQRRLVAIQNNLLEWLTPYCRAIGPVAPNVDAFGERLKELSKAAHIDPWPHNALRHSFGSYFYAKTKNEDLTAAEMGNSPAIVHRHYKEIVKGKATDAFWNIRPSNLEESEKTSEESPKNPVGATVRGNLVPALRVTHGIGIDHIT